MLPNVNRKFAAMLMLLALLLSGCQTPPIRPCEPPPPPMRPPLQQPLPESSYLNAAQANIEAWQKRLTDTPAISKP